MVRGLGYTGKADGSYLIFQVSNVTMEGIPDLHTFLNLLPKRVTVYNTKEVELHLDASWTVPGVGTVIGGHLMSGAINVGDKLWFGPSQNQYVQITVRTIQCKRVPVQRVACNSYVCVGVKGIHKKDVRKGNVLVSNKAQQVLCTRLCADIQVLKMHSTTIRVGYQPILHSQNVRASVSIEDIVNKVSAGPEEDPIPIPIPNPNPNPTLPYPNPNPKQGERAAERRTGGRHQVPADRRHRRGHTAPQLRLQGVHQAG